MESELFVTTFPICLFIPRALQSCQRWLYLKHLCSSFSENFRKSSITDTMTSTFEGHEAAEPPPASASREPKPESEPELKPELNPEPTF